MELNSERLRQIETLYHLAVEWSPADRAALLDAACGDDANLRREVEELLQQRSVEGLLDRPAVEQAARPLAPEWTPGTRLGPYEITARVAEGGMGTVYRGRDTRLGREVAIKTAHPEFLERFRREARAISALNHRNICTLFDVGPDYLVMEWIEGVPLPAPAPLERAIDWARQIIAGLGAAHDKGIVHRDLKPSNLLLTADGTVKILDFGLARAYGEAASALGATLTETGTILGTPAYMAPEQAQGRRVDRRADTWAFGVVLHELISGQVPLGGKATLPAGIPGGIHRLLDACLRMEPGERLDDIRDALRYFDEQPPRRQWLATVVAGAAGVVLGAGAVWLWPKAAAPERATARFLLSEPADADSVVPSPDGRQLAITGGGSLWIRALNTTAARRIEAVTGAARPFWSPDSRRIGYVEGRALKWFDTASGEVHTIAILSGEGGSGAWGPNERIVVAGAAEKKLAAPGRWPCFLDNGVLLYADGDRIQAEGRGVVLDHVTVNGIGSAPGHLLWIDGSTLYAQRMNARSLRLEGQPRAVAHEVEAGAFNVSRNGVLAWRSHNQWTVVVNW